MAKDKDAKSKSEKAAESPARTTDVAQIDLAQATKRAFPSSLQEDYRVIISDAAFEEVRKHAQADTSVEECGVLAGRIFADESGPYLQVEHAIEGAATRRTGSQVTFTHETWEHVHKVMGEKFPDLRIVGWYHSHPGLGVFLSDMDQFIQDNFFDAPHSIALVYDPRSEQKGVFHWRKGRSERLRRYWVGRSLQYDLETPEPVEEKAAVRARSEEESEDERTESRRERTRAADVSDSDEDVRSKLVWAATAALALFFAFLLGCVIMGYMGRQQGEESGRQITTLIRAGLFRDGLDRQLALVHERLSRAADRVTEVRSAVARQNLADSGAALAGLDAAAQAAREARANLEQVIATYSAAEMLAARMGIVATLPEQVAKLDSAIREEREQVAQTWAVEARLLLDQPGPDRAAARKQAELRYLSARRLAPWLAKSIDQAFPEFARAAAPPTSAPARTQPPTK